MVMSNEYPKAIRIAGSTAVYVQQQTNISPGVEHQSFIP